MIQVDPNWEVTFQDKKPANFWLNLSLPTYQTTFYCIIEVNGEYSSLSSDTQKELGRHGLSISCTRKHHVLHTTVQKNGSKILEYTSQSPYSSFKLNKGTTFCFDVTPNLLLTGHPDGGLYVHELTKDGLIPMRALSGHLSDVNTTRFFPSGTVVLSGGGDMMLKIWTLMNDGVCVAEFKGHKRGVLSSDLIDRGRNFVSSSSDGTVILWDVPNQTQIHLWGDKTHAINECRIAGGGSNGVVKDAREVGTEGKVLLLASEAGHLFGYDVRQRSEIFSYKTSSAVNTVVSLPQNEFILSGEQDGTVTCWDNRNMQIPYKTLNLDQTPITKLLPKDNQSCWIACGNGMTYNWNIQNEMPLSTLVSDTEPINGILYTKPDHLTTVSRRGIIRIYSSP